MEEFQAGTPTAAHAARAVGCDLRNIVKSLVFDCGGRIAVAMVPGDRRADAGKVAAACGAGGKGGFEGRTLSPPTAQCARGGTRMARAAML